MKTFLKAGVFLISIGALASNTDPALYQYWFDRDEVFRSAHINAYDANSNPLSVDASALPVGGHALNYRMANQSGSWGSVMTKYFKVSDATQTKDPKESTNPVLMQYWFDRDEVFRSAHINAYDANSNPLSVDASALSVGGHALNYRMANQSGSWGSVMTKYFVVPVTTQTNDPKEFTDPVLMQYWFDRDYASGVKNTVPYDANSNPLSVDISTLPVGGHVLNYRTANKFGSWGSVMTKYFMVPVATQIKDSKEFTDPVLMQYWFDGDYASGVKNTVTYDANSNPLSVDASALPVGGHALNYRTANKFGSWGSVMTKYFSVPVAPDNSSSKPVAYRLFLSDKIIARGEVSDKSGFTVSLDISESTELTTVDSRTFKYFTGEKSISMDASGSFPCFLQMLSEKNEWGAPIVSEISKDITTKLPVDSVPVPYDYTFAKPNNNGFKAYRFFNPKNRQLYFKSSQDCVVELYYVYKDNESNLSNLDTFTLSQGVTTKINVNRNSEIIAIVYNTPISKTSSDSDVFLRVMFDDNRVPKPEVTFDKDNWLLSMSCLDQRATIHYTLDGTQPTHDSPVYNAPLKLTKYARVRAIAVYGDLHDSYETDVTIKDQMKLPMPQLVFYGGNGMNEFILTNSVEDVTTYYVIGSEADVYDESQRNTFDGNPFVIDDSSILKAYSFKTGVGQSDVLTKRVYLSNYASMPPSLLGKKKEGDEDVDVHGIKYYFRLSLPNDSAKYRILPGKKDFQFGEEIVESEWTKCGPEWIELPGGAFSGNQTIQAFTETEGKEHSAVMSFYTDWVVALKPKAEYDNGRLKLFAETPGGVIKYTIDTSSDAEALIYNPEELPDGIDFSNVIYITAWVEAEGYTASEVVRIQQSDFDLLTPTMGYEDDGYLHIRHDKEDVNIVANVSPEQKLDTVASNHLRFIPEYNTSVEAYATKKGFKNSKVTEMHPISKPVIIVDAYSVTINSLEGDVYYTIDGSLPTKQSALYQGSFETPACTVRAVAFSDGRIPSEAQSVKVMDPAHKPEITQIVGGFVKLKTSTPDATIYYSLNQGISNGNRKVYDETTMPDGIDINNAYSLYAYAEADGFRRSETLEFIKSANTLREPTLRYENGFVVGEHDDSSVEIIFSDENGNILQPDANNPRRVKVAYNSSVDAYASKKGYVESRTVRLGCTDAPQISVDLFTVTVRAKSYQSVTYTTDGSMPTASSKVYSEPLTFSESCTFRAVAFEEGLIPAETEPVSIVYSKTSKPEVNSYDGRYLTLTAESGSTIRYVVGDEDANVMEGFVYNGSKIDAEGLVKVRAVALKDGADVSDEMIYTPEYYANETDVYVSQKGFVKSSFEWCSDLSAITSLNVHGSLVGTSMEDSGDYSFLRSLPKLRHLDLSDVTDTYVPQRALDTDKLLSVVLPNQMADAGENIFGDSNSTLCSLVIPGDRHVPDYLLTELKNSNLLLYVRSTNYASNAIANTNGTIRNVVVPSGFSGDYRAENVLLTYGLPFYCCKEFDAEKISFTRPFTKETQISGFGSGWETITVPFNVQSVESAGRDLKPFDSDSGNEGYHFWLFGADDTEWTAKTSIFANTPYLIAMPNNPFYADEYVVNGNVVFSSNVVTVPVTPSEDEMTASFGVGRYVVGNYQKISKDESVLALNESAVTYQNQSYNPGGIFISNERDVLPFEAYVESNGAKAIPAFDQSTVDELLGSYGTLIWGEKYSICIRSSIPIKARIYDTVGQLIRVVDVSAGETIRVEDITPGIYFVGNTKILVKG